MKNSFNFLQVANWIYIIRTNLRDFRVALDKEKINKEDGLNILKSQKRHLELIKDILNKNVRLMGIQPNFLKNLKQIKKEYGIEE